MHEIMKMRSIIDCLEFRDFPGSSSIFNLIDYWPVKVPKFFMEYFINENHQIVVIIKAMKMWFILWAFIDEIS